MTTGLFNGKIISYFSHTDAWTCNWTEKEDKQLLKSKFDIIEYESQL